MWYDVLNLGFKVSPVAGTDYPCADQRIPGHERFYTKIDKEYSYENWLKAVEEGKTFVTTGPIADFSINGNDLGSELVLKKADSVQIECSIQFDPQNDNLKHIEIIQNGEIIKRISRYANTNKVQVKLNQYVAYDSWFAIRAYGNKLNENTWHRPAHLSAFTRLTNLHTAPIYVSVNGTKNIKRDAVVVKYLSVLDDMVEMLSPENIDYLAIKNKRDWDRVPQETIEDNRLELLEEIALAKHFFNKLGND